MIWSFKEENINSDIIFLIFIEIPYFVFQKLSPMLNFFYLKAYKLQVNNFIAQRVFVNMSAKIVFGYLSLFIFNLEVSKTLPLQYFDMIGYCKVTLNHRISYLWKMTRKK